MGLIRKRLERWPVVRQLARRDPVALRDSARSASHVGVRSRTETADRVIEARAEGWQDQDAEGHPLNRTMAIASLGGATLDNEENYLIKKLFCALGIVQVENQARI